MKFSLIIIYNKNLGIILLNLKNYDEALCSFSRSIDLNPKDAKYHKSKGI